MVRLLCLLFTLTGFASPALASGGIVNWYAELHRALIGGDQHSEERFVVIGGGLFVLLVTSLIGVVYRSRVQAAGDVVVPEGRFGLRTAVESAMDLCVGLAKDILGSEWKTYSPLLAGIFMYIFVSNIGGLVPGVIPATENFSNNLAVGLMVFVIYNFAGFKEHGLHYLKQFTGPMLAVAPLVFVIELIGHSVRPLSLSLRLMSNIFADHLLVSIFSTNVPYIIVPSGLMFFGLLVALVQSYLFTLLTSVYISLAVSHDH
jgi:F-type H+-transporting ATPase subunit a